MKSNVIRRKIRTTTRFLTQDSAQIDLIPCQIKGFSFPNSKTIVGIQELISSYSLNEITFKHSVDAKIDLEVIGRKIFKDFGV